MIVRRPPGLLKELAKLVQRFISEHVESLENLMAAQFAAGTAFVDDFHVHIFIQW